ncbi:MAG: EamA family transporter [Burkholderiales bacterium]|nr:EamA family transporter [Burkholderiales bacterium]
MHVAAMGELILLGALWGAAFVFMRAAAPEFGAVTLAATRVVLAAAVLGLLLLWLREPLRWREHAGRYLAIGALNTALPFVLFSFAALHVPASYSAIANATTPIWSALIGRLAFAQRLSLGQVAGLGLGFFGVVVLVGVEPAGVSPLTAAAVAAGLLGAALYALAGHWIDRHLATGTRVAGATGLLLGAALWLALPGLAAAPSQWPSARAWTNVIALAILCTALGYVLFFRLIRRHGAQRAASVAFLFPAFAALWGALFLGEPITTQTLAGMLLVLAGTALVMKLPRELAEAWQRTQQLRRALKDRLLWPVVCALLPNALARPLMHALSRSPQLYAYEAQAALIGLRARAAQAAHEATLDDLRFCRLADHRDLWLSFTRPKRWAFRAVRAEEPPTIERPALIVTFHFGGGWWLPARWGALGAPVSIVMRRGKRPEEPGERLLWALGQFRMRRIAQLSRAPLIAVEDGATLLRVRRAWQAGNSVLALLDLPPQLVDRTSPVAFLGETAHFPSALLTLALREGRPIYLYLGETLPESLTPRYLLERIAGTTVEEALGEIVAALERAIRRRPGAWHGWSEVELYFKR